MNEVRTKEVLEVMIANETALIDKLQADKSRTYNDIQLTQQLTDAYWRRRNWDVEISQI